LHIDFYDFKNKTLNIEISHSLHNVTLYYNFLPKRTQPPNLMFSAV